MGLYILEEDHAPEIALHERVNVIWQFDSEPFFFFFMLRESFF